MVIPTHCCRDLSYLSCSSRLSVFTATMWTAALLALAAISVGQSAACRLPAFPAWRALHGGGRPSGGWFARMIELLAAAPVLLVPPSCLVAAASPVVSAPAGAPQLASQLSASTACCKGVFQSQHKVWCIVRQQDVAAHQPNHGTTLLHCRHASCAPTAPPACAAPPRLRCSAAPGWPPCWPSAPACCLGAQCRWGSMTN